jgi:hypothetical protein
MVENHESRVDRKKLTTDFYVDGVSVTADVPAGLEYMNVVFFR